MADRIFARLGPNCALGSDSLQWILYRSRRRIAPPDLNHCHWESISYVRSNKFILYRCIKEKSLRPDNAGIAILDSLPETFDEWKAKQ